jgi:hypothetical protein
MVEKFQHYGRLIPILKFLPESDLLLSRARFCVLCAPFIGREPPNDAPAFFDSTNVSSSSSSPTSGIISSATPDFLPNPPVIDIIGILNGVPDFIVAIAAGFAELVGVGFAAI